MIAEALNPKISTERRPRKDLSRLSAQESMILYRMRCIDRGQGCHASIERIGRSYDDRHQNFSPAQTRRHLRRLRELGEICFAGQTADGRNVYLLPDGTYRREDVPIDLSRPVEHLKSLPSGATWSTEKAAQILKLSERGEVATRITMIEGYPVNRQILKSHSETTIRHAIHRLKATYPTFQNIKSPSALLRHFLSLEIQEQQKRRAAETTPATPKTSGEPRLPADVEKQILALLREGRPAEANQLAAKWASGTPADAPTPAAAPDKPAAMPPATLAVVIQNYLKLKKGSDTPPAGSYHVQKAGSLMRLLGAISVHELTPAELVLYERKRRSDRVSERTIREELKVLRQALEHGVAAGRVAREVVEALPPGRASPQRSRNGSL